MARLRPPNLDRSSSRSAWILVVASALLLAAGPAAAQQVTRVPLVVNDLVYDPIGNLLYGSLPSGAVAHPNTIAVIDPSNGAILSYIAVGGDPYEMAVSDSGRYLYVSLDAIGTVMQVNLQTNAAGPQFALPGAEPFCPTPVARGLAVQPGHDTVVAVARGCYRYGSAYDVSIYDVDTAGAVRRSAIVSSWDVVSLTFGSASELYGYNSYSTGRGLSRLAVSLSGVTLVESVTGIMAGSNDMAVAAGRIYAPDGQVVDAATFKLLGTFPIQGYPAESPAVLPDPGAGLVFFAQDRYYPNYITTLQAYDTTTYLQAWSLSLGGTSERFPRGLAKVGASRLAFRGSNGILLVDYPASRPVRYRLRVDKAGTGTGSVVAASAGVSCGTACTADIDAGGVVTLTANANSGSVFVGWTGDPDCVDGRLTMTQARACTALFSATAPKLSVRRIALQTRGLIYDAVSGYLYASVAGANGPDGNSVIAIDPVTGNTAQPVWVGSEPTALALTDDHRYLYVALQGAYAVNRLGLPGLDAPAPFPLTMGFLDIRIASLLAQPGNSDVLLVSHGYAYNGFGIEVYDHGTVRPVSFRPEGPFGPGTALAFATASDVVFTRDWDRLMSAKITANGLENAQAGQAGAFESESDAYRLTFANNRFYGDMREIVDVNGARVTVIPGVLTSLVLPGAGMSPLLYLETLYAGGTHPRVLAAYDDSTLASLWTAALPAGTEYGGEANDLVSIADNVIAFRTATAVFIVDTTRIAGALLTVAKGGKGTGKITAGSRIDCGTICAARFTADTVVTVTATADGSSKFTGWTGDPDCADGTVTMSVGRNCTATFALRPAFTDHPIVSGVTPVKAVHITELRTPIGELRTRYGLAAYAWTNSSLVVNATTMMASHVAELRAALADVYAAAGLPAPIYTTSPITVGATVITAADIMELRAAINAIW